MIKGFHIDVIIAIISASSGLLGSIIGAIAAVLAVRISYSLQRKGKVQLFARIVNTPEKESKPWGYHYNSIQRCQLLLVPVWLDVANTCGIPRLIRDVNLCAYIGNRRIGEFTQIQGSKNKEQNLVFGNNEAYSFTVPDNSICRYKLFFSLSENELEAENKNFDNIRLEYYDEENSRQSFFLVSIDRCWERGPLERVSKWIALTKDNNQKKIKWWKNE